MKASGQAATEYMSTYGWAVLVLFVVGIVLWQLGVFDIRSRLSPSSTGFSVLVPTDWSLSATGCQLVITLANGAGEPIKSIDVVGTGSCTPSSLTAGGSTMCTKTLTGCSSKGSSFQENLVVTYQRSSDNQSFQTAGALTGNTEA